MRTIGIRAEPNSLTFAIYDAEPRTVMNVEEIRIPRAFTVPEALKYVRSNLLDVIREYEVTHAGVRVTEPSAQRISIERVQIEGVVQEAFASSSVLSYYAGHVATITSRLGFDRTSFKPMVAGEQNPGVDCWDRLTKHGREAVLCAMGAANA